MSESSRSFGALNNHYGIFLPCVMNNATPEQQQYWYKRILNFGITGCYCQTELGHGSNVLGMQTTATYDPVT